MLEMLAILSASIKNVGDTQVGDTITSVENPATEPLIWLSQNESYGVLWTYIQLIHRNITIFVKHLKSLS